MEVVWREEGRGRGEERDIVKEKGDKG